MAGSAFTPGIESRLKPIDMHAFVPGFSHDIFISYAHRDDPIGSRRPSSDSAPNGGS